MRVLLVRLDGIGDAAVCTPLLVALLEAGHEVGIALTTRNAGLFAPHAIVAEHGTVRGWLDGTPYEGPRFLAPGAHELRPASSGGRLAILWAPAAAHGFSPFDAKGATS